MPKIFLFCEPTGGGSGRVHGSTPGGDVLGCAVAEDGTCLASHLSSSVEFSKHDMGVTSDWKHDRYRSHYPDGYELEWVDDVESSADLMAALAKNEAMAKDQTEG